MNFGILFIGCSIIVLARDVKSSELVRSLLVPVFPRDTGVIKVTQLEMAQASGENYAVLDTVGLIQQYGYPAEEHRVTTEDGYIIIFFRISGSPTSPPMKGKPVVFIQHGVLASSDTWVLFGPDKDLAFILADCGYDVWLGNVRGNTYGRSHTNLTTSDEEFWDYSYHEIATLDIPAMIDYALEYSGQTKLSYIGHSMGTATSYVLLSEKPEYNDKMSLVVSLAPVGLWKEKLNLFMRMLIITSHVWKPILNFIGIYGILPQSRFDIITVRTLCRGSSITQFICIFMVDIMFGRESEDFNYNRLPSIGTHNPAGISLKTLVHFRDNIESDHFRQYDYGHTGNVKKYGTKEPPSYDLTKISAPCALFYGYSDALAKETNVAELAQRLPNVFTVEAVPSKSFNHIDFIWATHAKKLLFDRLMDLICIHSEKSEE